MMNGMYPRGLAMMIAGSAATLAVLALVILAAARKPPHAGQATAV